MTLKRIGPQRIKEMEAMLALRELALPYLPCVLNSDLFNEIARRGLVLTISPTNVRTMEWKSTNVKMGQSHEAPGSTSGKKDMPTKNGGTNSTTKEDTNDGRK